MTKNLYNKRSGRIRFTTLMELTRLSKYMPFLKKKNCSMTMRYHTSSKKKNREQGKKIACDASAQ